MLLHLRVLSAGKVQRCILGLGMCRQEAAPVAGQISSMQAGQGPSFAACVSGAKESCPA